MNTTDSCCVVRAAWRRVDVSPSGRMVSMTNARPAHCTITLHTSEGMNTFLTEDLVPDSDKDMTDPQTVSTALGARLSNNGRIIYTARGGVETVFAHALLRMSVTPESQEPGSTDGCLKACWGC